MGYAGRDDQRKVNRFGLLRRSIGLWSAEFGAEARRAAAPWR
jgi:hypothetical protein